MTTEIPRSYGVARKNLKDGTGVKVLLEVRVVDSLYVVPLVGDATVRLLVYIGDIYAVPYCTSQTTARKSSTLTQPLHCMHTMLSNANELAPLCKANHYQTDIVHNGVYQYIFAKRKPYQKHNSNSSSIWSPISIQCTETCSRNA